MLLAIDIGNTNIVVGLLDKSNIVSSFRLNTDKTGNIDLISNIKLMLDKLNIKVETIIDSIVSSVVPEVIDKVLNDLNFLLGKKPYIVNTSLNLGLNIEIDNPNSLGSDRICDLVAVSEEYNGPSIIIDMGTATTISILGENRNYIGGMIIPGIKTSLDALSSKASKLPEIDLEDPKSLIGKNTIDCMKSGIIYGNTCLIDGLIKKIKEELNYNFTIVSTGGLARYIIKHSSFDIIYDENLLLKGLYYIYKNNKC